MTALATAGSAPDDDGALQGDIDTDLVIIGAGYTKFGERWDKGVEDLLVEACGDAIKDAGIKPAN